MDNSAPVYQQSWELPIVVREHAVEGNECSLANIMWLLLPVFCIGSFHWLMEKVLTCSRRILDSFSYLIIFANRRFLELAVQELNLKSGKLNLYVLFCSILFCIMMSFYDVMFSTGHTANRSSFWIL